MVRVSSPSKLRPWSEFPPLRISDHGPSFLPRETQTMVRVNCQNGDGGGSWVGEISKIDHTGVPVTISP